VGCCGKARAALRANVRGSAAPLARPPSAGPYDHPRLENVRRESLRLRGAKTGRTYVFTPAKPVQTVHPADADVLLRSGHFRPVR
jgi:hypothetical protein